MTFEITNETSGIVHVALYKRSPLRPAEPAVAWTIVSPPPRGRAILSIPKDYRVFVRYSFSPEDPWRPVYQTQALSLHRNNDSLSIREISLGRSASGAILARSARKVGLGELRIENDFSTGVWCHVQLGEHDVHLPWLLPPHGALAEALGAPFFLAVVGPLARVGEPLAEHEIRATAIELEAGKGGAFTVRLNHRQGYRITRGAPLPGERALWPKETASPLPPKPKKAPRVSEKKLKMQAAPPKADRRKREAAKKLAKKLVEKPAKSLGKPASRQRGKKFPSSPLPPTSGEA